MDWIQLKEQIDIIEGVSECIKYRSKCTLILGCLYTLSRMMSIVSTTGTLVNKLSTSSVEMLPTSSFSSSVSSSILRNSSDDRMLYFSGVYCLNIDRNVL